MKSVSLNWKVCVHWKCHSLKLEVTHRVALNDCCKTIVNTKLSRTVLHFSFVGNPAIFNPEDGDSMFLQNAGMYVSLDGVTIHKNNIVRTSCALISKKRFELITRNQFYTNGFLYVIVRVICTNTYLQHVACCSWRTGVSARAVFNWRQLQAWSVGP
jgi:hypothetical protein